MKNCYFIYLFILFFYLFIPPGCTSDGFSDEYSRTYVDVHLNYRDGVQYVLHFCLWIPSDR